jgi:hypothetical protein
MAGLNFAIEHPASIMHECGHAVACHALGGEIREIACGPATEAQFGSLLRGYVDHDRERLTPFNLLVVAVCGELAAATYEKRKPDFTGANLQGDMRHASELVHDFYGHDIDDVTDTPYFRRAIQKGEDTLRQWTPALVSLFFKLRRYPYRISGTEATRIICET